MNAIPQRAPAILRSIAVAGVLVAIIGTVVIWLFLGDLEDTTDRSLLIGEQATVALNETIDIAEQVLDAVDDGLSTVQATLGTIDDVLQSTAGLAAATGSLSAALPTALAGIDDALATVQRLAQTVDSTLSALSALPFGPDYDPDVPLPDAFGNIRAALDPITQQLATISTELQDFAAGSGDLNAEIDSLIADVARTRDALSGTDDLLTQYRQTTTEAGRLAADTRDNLAGSVLRMRIVLVALALLLVLSQFVPWMTAALIEERRSAPRRDVVDDPPNTLDTASTRVETDATSGSAPT